MFDATIFDDTIEVTMNSELVHVDQSVELLRQLLAHHQAEHRFFEVAIVAREALNNAILHGNRGNPAKNVLWRAQCRHGSLFLYVKDEGQGFDWKAWLSRGDSEPEAESGRGHEIFRLLAHNITYNPCGNALCLEIPL